MENKSLFTNDFYIISGDFKLISFNESVAKTYTGIKVGDYCYKATMKRDTPCMHCPVAGNSDCDCPVYFDPFYNEWIEAVFSDMGDGNYAVSCRPASERGFRIFDELGKEGNEELIYKLSGRAVNNYLDEQKEKKKLEKKYDELRMQTIAEAIRGGFFFCKRDEKLSIQYVSEKLAKMLGYTVEEFIEASKGNALGLVNEEDVQNLLPQINRAIEKDELFVLRYRMRCKDGSWKHVENRGRLLSNQDSQDEYWCVISDRDEMAMYENAFKNESIQLEKTRSLNNRLVEQLSIIQSMSKIYFASYYIDLENEVFNEINSVEHIRKTIGSAGSMNDAAKALCENTISPDTSGDLLSFMNTNTINKRLKYKDVITCDYCGKVAGWCQMYIIAGDRDADGNLKTIFLAVRTIHDEKVREENARLEIEKARLAAEKANKAKTDFLFNMSHDIRTPMNAIVGYSELIKKEADNPDSVRNYQEKLQKSGDILLSLINGVLEMARIESGKSELDETYFVAGSFLEEIADAFENAIKEKNLTVVCNESIQNKHIMADVIKTRQIYSNLLGNAIKYTPVGGEIHLTAVELPSDRENYVLYEATIEDNGIGMSEDFLPTLFEPFSREKTSTAGKVVGTGLGMSIVKGLVDTLGGTISVESKIGVGTKFILHFYYRIADEDYYSKSESLEEKYEQNALVGKRILLAEDNEFNAEIAISLLEDYGIIVEHAKDGVECVDMLSKSEQGYYSAILMDVQMPNMDGYKATQTIRNMDESYKNSIPIIAMTANAFEEDKKNAWKAGMNGHVAKPIKMDIILSTLSKIIYK